MGNRADYDSSDYKAFPFEGELADVLKTEFSEQFADGMRNRMIVSYYKYGPVAEGYPGRVNALDSLSQRLSRYRETGNSEWLLDAANFAMIEFMHPAHPDAHFRPTDSHESPGRARHDGTDPHGKNTPVDSVVERLRQKYASGE